MRKFEALELEASDFSTIEKRNAAIIAMSYAELVTYRGHVVKNRNGFITRTLFSVRADEPMAFPSLESGQPETIH